MRTAWADFRKCGKTEKGLGIWTDLDLNPNSVCVCYRILGMSSSSGFSSVKQIILTLKIHCRDQGLRRILNEYSHLPPSLFLP